MNKEDYIKTIQESTVEYHWTEQGLKVGVWYACIKTFMLALKELAYKSSIHFDTVIDSDGDICFNHFEDALCNLGIDPEDIFPKNNK